MPRTSRDTASDGLTVDGLDVRMEHLEGGYSVCFESHTADADLAGLFRGLPKDPSQLPRWGYVVRRILVEAGARVNTSSFHGSPGVVAAEAVPVLIGSQNGLEDGGQAEM